MNNTIESFNGIGAWLVKKIVTFPLLIWGCTSTETFPFKCATCKVFNPSPVWYWQNSFCSPVKHWNSWLVLLIRHVSVSAYLQYKRYLDLSEQIVFFGSWIVSLLPVYSTLQSRRRQCWIISAVLFLWLCFTEIIKPWEVTCFLSSLGSSKMQWPVCAT